MLFTSLIRVLGFDRQHAPSLDRDSCYSPLRTKNNALAETESGDPR